MKLIDDFEVVARHAWSYKLAILAALLSGADVTMQALTSVMPSAWLSGAAGLVAAAAALSRFIYQPKVSGDGSAA